MMNCLREDVMKPNQTLFVIYIGQALIISGTCIPSGLIGISEIFDMTLLGLFGSGLLLVFELLFLSIGHMGE